MNLELLANEVLLDLFEYFHAVQLIRSFHGLNKRFDTLIFTHFRTYKFDFRTGSKQDFDTVCQLNLPLFADQIGSLSLSNDDEIPQQIDLFLDYGWKLNRFQSLTSLSLDHIRSGSIICELLHECPQLLHLKLNSCYFGGTQDDILHFVDSIWNMCKLIDCHLNISLKNGLHMSISNNVSFSLQHVSVIGVSYRIDQLTHLYECTPCLRHFALDLANSRLGDEIKVPFSSITSLNLLFVGIDNNIIENLLQHVPNIRRLKIETMYLQMDGDEWEHIIRNYLPKLEVFQLKMRFAVRSGKHHILKSFQTRFWLEEKRWFIRFHYNIDDTSNMICLYTLPYSFTYLDVFFPLQFETTCPNNVDCGSYKSVQQLVYRSSFNIDTIVSNLHFSNVTQLLVTLPLSNHLLSIVKKLDQLSSLEVSRSKSMFDVEAQMQLQNLLDQAPYICSLKFNSWREVQCLDRDSSVAEILTPIILKTRLIRQVNLRGYDWWFNDDECVRLCDSSLIKSCEVLFIKVQNRMNILYLIRSLNNLRSLIVQSRDDNWSWVNNSSIMTDLYVEWLKDQLPPKCSIKRDFRFIHSIRIWINL